MDSLSNVRREARMQIEVEPEIQQTTSPVGMPMNTAPKGQAHPFAKDGERMGHPDQDFLDFVRPLHERFIRDWRRP